MAIGRIFKNTDLQDVQVGNVVHTNIVVCRLWKCGYMRVLGKKKGECIISALNIKPNSKKCKQRDVFFKYIKQQKALWNGKKKVSN